MIRLNLHTEASTLTNDLLNQKQKVDGGRYSSVASQQHHINVEWAQIHYALALLGDIFHLLSNKGCLSFQLTLSNTDVLHGWAAFNSPYPSLSLSPLYQWSCTRRPSRWGDRLLWQQPVMQSTQSSFTHQVGSGNFPSRTQVVYVYKHQSNGPT